MSKAAVADPDPESLIERLERTEAELSQARTRLEEFGRDRVEELAEVHRAFTALLDRYEEQVVGDAGDVRTNVEFQSQIAETVNDIPKNVLLRETFIECANHLKRKYFKQSHFDHVREQLEPVDDIVARLDEYERARDAHREARREIRRQLRTLEERITELERLRELGEADLDAPTDRLHEPIEAYNERTTEAFEEFLAERPAREIVSLLEATRAYPLVEFEIPPAELRRYLREAPVGEERISTLLEYAGYSRSKLSHYVDDPDRFAHVVGNQKTYLSGLAAEPLLVSWPPPSAGTLRWRCEELTAVLNRVSPSAVESLRAVAALPRETDYERLRTSAVAREQLTDTERERIAAGGLEADLEQLRDQRDRLAAALDADSGG